tara:strand:- start:294 stop:1061 length:768 start_codon:yes stop_codon:yes gene_type:complete
MFGLEGSGFILSLSLTLLLTGLTFYYFRMKIGHLENIMQKQNAVLHQFISTANMPVNNNTVHLDNENNENNVKLTTTEVANSEWKAEPFPRTEISLSSESSDSESDDDEDDDDSDSSDEETESNNLDIDLSNVKTINLENVEMQDIITGACVQTSESANDNNDSDNNDSDNNDSDNNDSDNNDSDVQQLTGNEDTEDVQQHNNTSYDTTDLNNLTVPLLRDLIVQHTGIQRKDANKMLKAELKETLEPILGNLQK